MARRAVARRKVVARKGSAPPTSGCRPDVILFHHRAEIGCLAWIRTKTVGVKARHAAVTLRGKDWWPARVTLPVQRIKSPLHHFTVMLAGRNGARGGIRTRTGDALNVVPLLVGLREQMKWILQPVLPRQEFFTKEIRPDASGHGGGNGRSLRCCPGQSGLMKPT